MSSHRHFLLLCLAGFSCFISYDLVRRPALSLFALSLGAEAVWIGLLVSLSTLTGVLLKLPMGAVSDIVDRRRLMVAGLCAFAFPPFAYPWISDVIWLGALRLVHGLATALFTPLALATVAELYAERRGEALGWYTSATQGGGLLGPMLGGFLVYAAGFNSTFLTAGLFGVVGLAVFFFIRTPTARVHRSTIGLAEIWRQVRSGMLRVIVHPGMVAVSVAEASKMMGNGALMAFLPVYGLAIGLNAAQVGMLFGVQALTSIVSKPMMGRVSDRWDRPYLILAGLSICGFTLTLVPQASSLFSLLFVAAGFGYGEAVVTSSSAALIADLADAKTIGAGMGLRGTIMDLGHAGGPVMAGLLIGGFGYGVGFGVVGVLQCVVAIAFGWLMTRIRRTAVL